MLARLMLDTYITNNGYALHTVEIAAAAGAAREVIAAPGAGRRILVLGGNIVATLAGTARWGDGTINLSGVLTTTVGGELTIPPMILEPNRPLQITPATAAIGGTIMYAIV